MVKYLLFQKVSGKNLIDLMKLTEAQFNKWFDEIKKAWETRNPEAAVALVADSFEW